MNPAPNIPAPRRRRGWLTFTVIVVGLLLAVPLFIALGAINCLRLGSDAAALRQSVVKAAPVRWNRQVEFSLGRITLALARSGLRFVKLDPEARLALDAIRGADVAVYEHSSGAATADYAATLAATDAAMDPRGWERAVTVLQPDDFVVIYFPKKLSPTDELRVCLVVLNHHELVVASVSGEVGPLLELIQGRPEIRRLSVLKQPPLI